LSFRWADAPPDLVEITIVMRNSTVYELENIIISGLSNRGSPYIYVGGDQAGSLMPDEEREAVLKVPGKNLDDAWAFVTVKNDETINDPLDRLVLDADKAVNRFEIICDDDMDFNFTVSGD